MFSLTIDIVLIVDGIEVASTISKGTGFDSAGMTQTISDVTEFDSTVTSLVKIKSLHFASDLLPHVKEQES